MKGIAYPMNGTSLPGSYPSTALISARAATWARSSRCSPRPAKRRASRLAIGRFSSMTRARMPGPVGMGGRQLVAARRSSSLGGVTPCASAGMVIRINALVTGRAAACRLSRQASAEDTGVAWS